jgi:hypothetical protein
MNREYAGGDRCANIAHDEFAKVRGNSVYCELDLGETAACASFPGGISLPGG